MSNDFKNRYFLLRHGKNIHQTEKKGILYNWPDDIPPCELIEEGIKEVQKAGEELKNKNIDLVFCSDVFRTKQTAGLISEIIGFEKEKIIYDQRLRDINWGIFAGQDENQAWAFYENNLMKKFELSPPEGENWNDCQQRMILVINEIEAQYENKNILIVSHGDPLWLLEAYFRGIPTKDLVINNNREVLKTGEIRTI